MTELSFLLELLLNHKLPKATKEAVTARVKAIEASYTSTAGTRIEYQSVTNNQVPSMQRIMAKNPDIAPVPVAVIAQTPAAVEAMNSREAAISASMAGKTDKVTGRPRKW